MEWREIREAVRSELRGRNLINPRLRLSALDSVDRLVSERYPEFLSNWTVVVEIGKQAVSRELARLKPTGTLNGAEKSVLSQAFVAAANSPPSRITPKNPHETGSQATASKILPVGSTDKDRTNQKTGLCPVIFPSSRLLILGTLPGDESIRLQRYYADAKNQFWRILSLVYGERVGTDYDERLEFLRRSGIALWDVLHGAERVGSLDSKIMNEFPNDFESFLANHRELKTVIFNGGAAKRLYSRHITRTKSIKASDLIQRMYLPSTSGTPGKNVLSFEEKVARWTIIRSL